MPLNLRLALVAFALLAACQPTEKTPEKKADASAIATEAARANAEKEAQAQRLAVLEECKLNLSSKTKEYKRLMASRDFWQASNTVRECAESLEDNKLRKLVAEAEIKSWVHDIESPHTLGADRIRAIEALMRDYPDRGKKYEALYAKLNAEAERDRQSRQAMSHFTTYTPPADRQTHKDTIEYCWEEQKRKSLDPGAARFAASACELMEQEYLKKYGRKP